MALSVLQQIALLVFMSSVAHTTSSGENAIGLLSDPFQSFPSAQKVSPPELGHADKSSNSKTGQGDNDDYGSDDDKIIKALEDDIYGNGNDENGQENLSSESQDSDQPNCSKELTVDNYCTDFSQQMRAYFNYNVSTSAFLASLLRKEILEALQKTCAPGDWCLPDSYHQEIVSGKAAFYGINPLCSETMFICLEAMMDERLGCEDKDLEFLMNSLDLLCVMEEVGKNTVEPECYARTIEAIYCVYADRTNPAGSQLKDVNQPDCTRYKVEMTETYLCAIDTCDTYELPFLERYEPWADIVYSADETITTCNITHTCQSQYNKVDHDSSTTSISNYETNKNVDDEYEDELEEILEEIAKETAGVQGQGGEEGNDENTPNEVNKNEVRATNNSNNAMMLSLVALTTVLVLCLIGLAFFGYRRYCHVKCGYDKWGYAKLVDEEAKLLRSEYS